MNGFYTTKVFTIADFLCVHARIHTLRRERTSWLLSCQIRRSPSWQVEAISVGSEGQATREMTLCEWPDTSGTRLLLSRSTCHSVPADVDTTPSVRSSLNVADNTDPSTSTCAPAVLFSNILHKTLLGILWPNKMLFNITKTNKYRGDLNNTSPYDIRCLIWKKGYNCLLGHHPFAHCCSGFCFKALVNNVIVSMLNDHTVLDRKRLNEKNHSRQRLQNVHNMLKCD